MKEKEGKGRASKEAKKGKKKEWSPLIDIFTFEVEQKAKREKKEKKKKKKK
ncbi:MAG: hypothetical protein H0W89_04305 [Candidatus Levybacteria bacterium]|nr:hypothetical protein [Candidatus Levybacteria bacterium]